MEEQQDAMNDAPYESFTGDHPLDHIVDPSRFDDYQAEPEHVATVRGNAEEPSIEPEPAFEQEPRDEPAALAFEEPAPEPAAVEDHPVAHEQHSVQEEPAAQEQPPAVQEEPVIQAQPEPTPQPTEPHYKSIVSVHDGIKQAQQQQQQQSQQQEQQQPAPPLPSSQPPQQRPTSPSGARPTSPTKMTQPPAQPVKVTTKANPNLQVNLAAFNPQALRQGPPGGRGGPGARPPGAPGPGGQPGAQPMGAGQPGAGASPQGQGNVLIKPKKVVGVNMFGGVAVLGPGGVVPGKGAGRGAPAPRPTSPTNDSNANTSSNSNAGTPTPASPAPAQPQTQTQSQPAQQQSSPTPSAAPSSSATATMPSPSQANVIKEGYLWKKGHKRRNWKHRWFILTKDYICYKANPAETIPLGMINLKFANAKAEVATGLQFKSKKRDFCFKLSTNNKVFLIDAQAEAELNEWVSAINKAIST